VSKELENPFLTRQKISLDKLVETCTSVETSGAGRAPHAARPPAPERPVSGATCFGAIRTNRRALPGSLPRCGVPGAARGAGKALLVRKTSEEENLPHRFRAVDSKAERCNSFDREYCPFPFSQQNIACRCPRAASASPTHAFQRHRSRGCSLPRQRCRQGTRSPAPPDAVTAPARPVPVGGRSWEPLQLPPNPLPRREDLPAPWGGALAPSPRAGSDPAAGQGRCSRFLRAALSLEG